MSRSAWARRLRQLAWAVAGSCVVASASAQLPPTDPVDQPSASSSGKVFTRARLTSTFDEGRDKPYVRLKLLPRAKIPFQVLTFRLKDRALIADIPVGAAVEFLAEPIDGSNTVTAIRQVPECKRFESCYSVRW